MITSLQKELKPLLLPWLVGAVAGVIPPTGEATATVAGLIWFGAFALMAAVPFGVEFQDRTISLLLSQPIERRQLWRDKLGTLALASAVLVLVNWQVQQFIVGLPAFLCLVVWMFAAAVICSSGFWILNTGSTRRGIAWSILSQLIIWMGIAVAAVQILGPMLGTREPQLLAALAMGGLIYCGVFAWLGRRFWRTKRLVELIPILVVLLLCGLGEWLTISLPTDSPSLSAISFAPLFVVVSLCSAPFWTLLARATFSGAVLTVASQFLAMVGVILVLTRFRGTEPGWNDWRVVVTVASVAVVYAAVLFRLGWKRFERFEMKEPFAGEVGVNLLRLGLWRPWSGWLRSRSDQALLNLFRKELRLQKPLFSLAAVFILCWLAVLVLHWVQPRQGYANLLDVLACLYAPVSLVLAGCLSLGEEKALGLTAWHLSLPVSRAKQWSIKFAAGAATGLALGLGLPFGLTELARALTGAAGSLVGAGADAWLAIALVSGALFLLGFWTATLVSNTVRAALIAVVSLVPVFLCGMLGSWCAQQSSGLMRDLLWLLPVPDAWAQPLGRQPADAWGALGFVAIVGTITLVQSLAQFRRVQLPGFAIFRHVLVLGAGIMLGAFWWTAFIMSAGK